MRTSVGYTGGRMPLPTYHMMGDHTESVRVYYDENVISYDDLLAHFWKSHSPVCKSSTQYRSAIWYHTPEQKEKALASKEKYEKEKNTKVYTHISKVKKYYLAEDYHQKFLTKSERRYGY
mmetsp:Transcript_17644/g.30028  ORF Transcript_17644/g.30028 Transcript_17644/m.30028 type:complete len:120 (+) Transcript_17644:185-544(+)